MHPLLENPANIRMVSCLVVPHHQTLLHSHWQVDRRQSLLLVVPRESYEQAGLATLGRCFQEM